jgi:hypothetical protein
MTVVIRCSVAADVRDDTIAVRPTFDLIWGYTGTDRTLTSGPIQAAIDGFLTTAASGATHPMQAYNSSFLWLIGVTQYTVSLYDQTLALAPGGRAGPAFYTHRSSYTSTPLGSGVPALPEQSTCVFSMRGDYVSLPEYGPPVGGGDDNPTRPRSTVRGRFSYFPLNAAAIQSNATNGSCEFTAGFLTDAKAQARALLQTRTVGGFALNPVIWSRKNASINQVAFFDVNSRPDTRRHRATKSPVHSWLSLP